VSDKKPKILIIDDRDRYVTLAHELLRGYNYATRCELFVPCWECPSRPGCTLTHAHDWAEAEQALARHRDVDVVLLDVAFELPPERLLLNKEADPEKSWRLQGIEILRRIRQIHGTLPVVLMTSMEELAYEDAADALEVDEMVTLAGPDAFDARALGLLIERVLTQSATLDMGTSFEWGSSTAMARLARDAKSLARTSLPLLLLGETGTGKSALAEQVIHSASGRKGPFVIADLATIPESLVAAELFGTAKGAFSGSVDRPGCFERAEGGTLFLDEIGNLSEEVQRMLLVTLQSGRFTRLGDGRQRAADVKVIAATNADIETLVQKGTFRADLYSRLNPAAALRIPPLRKRREDIAPLAERIVEKVFTRGADRDLLGAYQRAAGINGSPKAHLAIGGKNQTSRTGVTFALSPKTYTGLRAHRWPGNVRELELLLASATVLALSDALSGAEKSRAATKIAPQTIPVPAKLVRDLLGRSSKGVSSKAATNDSEAIVQVKPQESIRATMRLMERQIFASLYRECNGDFKEMAHRLVRGDSKENEHRVRLRFNQLGLRVRDFK
jgi:DNA-binding NtrC family response regulator